MDRVELPESMPATPKLPVDKTLQPFDPDQLLLLPPPLDDCCWPSICPDSSPS